MKSKSKNAQDLPSVNTSEFDGVRYLHLGSEWVQGSMKIDKPYEIDLEYVQRMMAWLLFMEPQSIPNCHAMQLGLGSGALTKFCAKKMGLQTTAIELNPQVIAACRLWFKLPKDSSTLSVILADAQEVVSHEHWRGQIDALQVDLYDQEAAAPVLDGEDFYQGCQSLLTSQGVMTVNLFGKNSQFEVSLEKIKRAFPKGTVWCFKPTKEGNTVVLAQNHQASVSREELESRADHIYKQWGLPAKKWLKVLNPSV
jgi:spermidine synthase